MWWCRTGRNSPSLTPPAGEGGEMHPYTCWLDVGTGAAWPRRCEWDSCSVCWANQGWALSYCEQLLENREWTVNYHEWTTMSNCEWLLITAVSDHSDFKRRGEVHENNAKNTSLTPILHFDYFHPYLIGLVFLYLSSYVLASSHLIRSLFKHVWCGSLLKHIVSVSDMEF